MLSSFHTHTQANTCTHTHHMTMTLRKPRAYPQCPLGMWGHQRGSGRLTGACVIVCCLWLRVLPPSSCLHVLPPLSMYTWTGLSLAPWWHHITRLTSFKNAQKISQNMMHAVPDGFLLLAGYRTIQWACNILRGELKWKKQFYQSSPFEPTSFLFYFI